MSEILQSCLPSEMANPGPLPGVRPLEPKGWLRVDDAYAAQMAKRRALLDTMPDDICMLDPGAADAADEVLEESLQLLPDLGFVRQGDSMQCPDGQVIDLRAAPLMVLGRLLQEDICILQKHGDEHVLTGAVLCFPSGWQLRQKFLKPMVRIHVPVASYDQNIARRVQRLFDGVQAGRPLCRSNYLLHADAELRQDRAEGQHRALTQGEKAQYVRAEHQSIVRMPKTQAVGFFIHTYVVKNPDLG